MERHEAADLLGVSTHASARQVRSAFRKRVKADHPDRNRSSNQDFQRLVAARDLLLTPAPEPLIEPTMVVDADQPRPPARPPTTLTYGYDPYQGPEHEEFTSRTPAAPMGSTQPRRKAKTSRLRRRGWQLLAAAAVGLLLFQLVLRGVFSSPEMCAVVVDDVTVEKECEAGDTRVIMAKVGLDGLCGGLEERLRVGDEIWCLLAR